MTQFDEPLDLTGADMDQATTFGTYGLVGAGRKSTLWTIHDYARAEDMRVNSPQQYRGMQSLYLFARHAGEELAALDLDGYMDIGAGVPQDGYLHTQVSPTTPVLYNDIDSRVVAKSREELSGNKNVAYVQHNVADIAAIIADADQHFKGKRRVGILATGILYFVDDPTAKHIVEQLYHWSAPGSMLAFTGWRDLPEDPGAQNVHKRYTGIKLYGRTIEETYELLKPWQPHGAGLLPFEDHLGLDVEPEQHGNLGIAGVFVHP